MKRKKHKAKTVHCPYCGARAVLKKASEVYGEDTAKGYLFVCSRYPECDSYVGVHETTKEPLGTLAGPELRRKRIQAHRAFDQIWKSGILSSRQAAYRWLGEKFCLNKDHAHIAMFSDYQCGRLIEECDRVLASRKCA